MKLQVEKYCRYSIWTKRLLVFLVTVCVLHVEAKAYAQRITISENNASLETVLQRLKKQTGLQFFYSEDMMREANPVTIDVKNETTDNLLRAVFANQPLNYTVNKNNVVIKRSPQKAGEVTAVQQSVSGVVSNAEGEALSGVNVRIKGANTVVTTNSKGYYEISAPQNAVLVYSYLGYQEQEVQVGERNMVNVTMETSISQLDDVVVVGYGEVSRRDLTGSVSSVNMAELEKAPVATFEEALAGRLAGVHVTSDEDQPGSDMNIVIRGAGSLTESTAPLYVVDGFPMEDFDAASINPEDIESIDVLKDASSTAVYGARGANGVVVIQTKQGTVGKPTIVFNTRTGISQTNNRMEMMDPYEFATYEFERNPDQASQFLLRKPEGVIADREEFEVFRNVPNIDWQDLLFRNGVRQLHSLSIRGGTRESRYTISGSVSDQKGAIINTGNRIYRGRASLNSQINSKLRTNINVNYLRSVRYGAISSEGFGTNALLMSAWSRRPMPFRIDFDELDFDDMDPEDDFMDPDIDPTVDSRVNPIQWARNAHRYRHRNSFHASGWAEYRFNSTLRWRTQLGYDHRGQRSENFYNRYTPQGNILRANNQNGIHGTRISLDRSVVSAESFMTYNKRFARQHRLNVVGGISMQSIASESFTAGAQNIENEALGIWAMPEGAPRPMGQSYLRHNMLSYFARANYDYQSKYLFTLTGRFDGSSIFADPFGFFPSGAFAWRIKEEEFMKGLTFVDDAKLRISYGHTGNNRINTWARFWPLIRSVNDAYSFGNATPTLGTSQSSMGNDALRWETAKQTDIGLDLSLFNERIMLVVDVYRKITDDLLLNANVPYTTGFARANMNIGKLQNQGLEIAVNTKNIVKPDFQWESNFNITFNRNKVLALSADEPYMLSPVSFNNAYTGSAYIATVGQQAASFLGMIWDGVYQYEDFNVTPSGEYVLKPGIPTNNPQPDRQPRPGDIRYRDVNGDGIINDLDNVIIGSPQPLHVGGLSNTFTYKNVSLNVLFQWSYGNEVLNGNKTMFEGNHNNRPLVNQFASYNDRWTEENPNSDLFRAFGGATNGVFSSRFIEDASFLRLKTLALDYVVPQEWSQRAKIERLALTVSAQNLFTWTNYSGMDPEVSVRNSVLTPGLDWSAYPRMRTMMFGLRATF